ncbi:unnamed protein product [Mytilus coruscus]|uniref:Uncharacterized protein n=1 Tax=Mytilus coruscus TaxID=42192 RepID=A0A6J8EWI4_MYTCO|nr:unnamed protein product [Mytilus coruscus]
MNSDEWKSLLKMANEMSLASLNTKVKGFIQHISVIPSYVMYWNESGIRLLHQLAKNNIVFWDATGSILKTRLDESKYLYYELAVANPTPKEPTIPVASTISNSQDTPQIHYWLSTFRLEEKKNCLVMGMLLFLVRLILIDHYLVCKVHSLDFVVKQLTRLGVELGEY